jgi:WD40 repeat protein
MPQNEEVLIEESSKGFDLKSVLSLTATTSRGFSRVLAITPYMWKVFDATGGHLKPICSKEEESPKWRGGAFVTIEMILIWKEDGSGVMYRLPKITLDSTHPDPSYYIVATLSASEELVSSTGEMPLCVLHREGGKQDCVVAGNKNGHVFLWPAVAQKGEFSPEAHPDPPCIPPLATGAFGDSWKAMKDGNCLSDTLFPPEKKPTMTCAVHLDSIGRLVCGHDNGTIVMFYPAQVATILLLSPRRLPKGWPQYCIMKGHVGKVTHLLHPNTFGDRYESNLLLSGGEDFTVRLWNLYSASLLHTFVAHAGLVTHLLAVPKNMSHRYQECVCSVGADHSVAILSLQDRKCVFLAAYHDATVTGVKWRPKEDFLLVACEDNTVYVWQLETRTLDRHLEGVSAEVVLKDSTPSPRLEDSQDPKALRVINLHPLPSDPVVQILLFNPQTIISILSKVHELYDKPNQVQQRKMEVGFRQYIRARQQGLDDVGKEVHGRNVASERDEHLQEEWTQQIINIVRLLLSCLHAWHADTGLDHDVESRVGLLKPVRPISFGMCSRKDAFSLVLPGWGIRDGQRTHPQSALRLTHKLLPHPHSTLPQLDLSAIQQQRWGLSRLLTTQHLLAVVAIANTLMNHIKGAQILSETCRLGDSLSEDSEEEEGENDSQQMKDNFIRATWSRITALHCVMLPEKQGSSFKPPNLTLLAERYPDKCSEIREAAQAILLSEMRRIGASGRQELIRYWSSKLPSQSLPTPRSPSPSEDSVYLDEAQPQSTVASPFQQYTALVILGVVGSEFCNHGDSKSKGDEVMDGGVARQVAKALQSVILEKPKPSLSLGTSWRRSAVDLMGRGFNLWSKYVSASRIIMGLLELCQLNPFSKTGSSSVSIGSRMMANTSRKSLSLMTIAKPQLMISTLSREVLTHLQASHIIHYPHSTLHPLPVGIATPTPTAGITASGIDLLLKAKPDVMVLMETALEKCIQDVTIMLVEVVDIMLFCLTAEQLKKEKHLMELIPSLRKLSNNVCFSPKTRKLAVGSKTGRIHIYDFKHFHCDSVNAHSGAVTALTLSDDGKMLASYAHGDSTLKVWQVGSTMLGVIRSPPKCVHSWPVISSHPSGSGVRLEWNGKSVILHSSGGLQHKYTM